MKLFCFFTMLSLVVLSCTHKSALSADFECESISSFETQKEEDLKRKFEISVPKSWKINLYQDEIQSSIFIADTAVSLSKSILIDATWVDKTIDFDRTFKLKNEREALLKGLIKINSNDFTFKRNLAHYTLYKGVKNNLAFQSLQTFIQTESKNFIQINIDIYGDQQVQDRICEALSIVENIKIKNHD